MCTDDVWVFRQSQGQLFKTRRNYVTFLIDGLCSPSAIEPARKDLRGHACSTSYFMPCLGGNFAHMLEAGLPQRLLAAGPQRRSPRPEYSAIRSKVAQAGGD
jgi:hypothetical protein